MFITTHLGVRKFVENRQKASGFTFTSMNTTVSHCCFPSDHLFFVGLLTFIIEAIYFLSSLSVIKKGKYVDDHSIATHLEKCKFIYKYKAHQKIPFCSDFKKSNTGYFYLVPIFLINKPALIAVIHGKADSNHLNLWRRTLSVR